MNEEKVNSSFVYYGTFYDTMRELEQQDEHLAYKFAKAVAEYGLYKEYDESDPIINALMQQVIFGIDNAEERRKKNVNDGSKGGRKKKNPDELIWSLLDSGKDKKEVAVQLSCSVRTIERAMSRRPSDKTTNAT